MVQRDPMPRWLLAVVSIGAAVVLWPFAPWVVLALWLGLYAQRIHAPMTKVTGGRSGLAATITVLLLLGFVLPLGSMIASLAVDAISLVREIMDSDEGKSVLERLVRGDAEQGSEATRQALTSTQGITDFLMRQGDRAWSIARDVLGAAAKVVIGLLILVTGMYGVLVEGRAWYAWAEAHAPVPASTLRRLADAFVETGRGLAVGIVGAGLLQSIVATIAYVALGVPQALALGMLTLLFSVVPAIGTAIVWLPVAAGLFLTGREPAAITLAVIGVGVIGTIDNIARPYLARRGKLNLPTYVVLLAMFGGVELMGAWGLMLGPLIIRLAKEALVIRAESTAQTVNPP
jgi:predicted PurR-regulated permease PerM